jgi:hypothetical protein
LPSTPTVVCPAPTCADLAGRFFFTTTNRQQGIFRKNISTNEIEAWRWKVRIGLDAETAIEAAANLPPSASTAAWLAADRILTKYGERFPACALPSEFGLRLSDDGIYLPRDLWMIISGYAVDPTDAAADGLSAVIVARAYCLTAGNAMSAESADLRLSILQSATNRNLIQFAFMFLFYAQHYELAERVCEDLLPFVNPTAFVYVGNATNIAICSIFRGRYDVASNWMSVVIDRPEFNAWSTGPKFSYRWFRFAQAWLAAAETDDNRAERILDGFLLQSDLDDMPLLAPFVVELRRYLRQPTTPPIAGLTVAHAGAVATLRFNGCRWLYPDVVVDTTRPPKTDFMVD